MKTAIIAAALLAASLGLASQAQAMDCYWDRAQHARVCRPNHQESREWRARHDGVREWNPRYWSNSPYHAPRYWHRDQYR